MLSQVFQNMGWPSVKPEQKEVVEAILETDDFVILPTGFGKRVTTTSVCLSSIKSFTQTVIQLSL